MSLSLEPFQRTDISTQPLGPTNYTGSYTSSKNTIAVVIDAWFHKQQEEEKSGGTINASNPC
jgi:hypothetical protein